MATNILAPITSVVMQNLVDQFLTGAEATQYTSSSVTTDITGATVCNTSGTTVNVSLSVVKVGNTAGASNRVLSVFPLAANTTLIIDELMVHVLGVGDFISGFASTGSVVSFVLSGTVYS